MTWIKICGITNLEDARIAVDAGADALGFVFYEKSPRKANSETARTILSELHSQVEKIGVFVEEADDLIVDVARRVGLTGIQLHFLSSDPRNLPIPISSSRKTYLALSARSFFDEQGDFLGFTGFKPDAVRTAYSAILLDSGTSQKPGGTGIAFDWQKAVPLVSALREISNVVVAGGLTSANVAEAMRILKPWGVDVSSGVEARPGKKDPEKVRAFINAVRTADRNA